MGIRRGARGVLSWHVSGARDRARVGARATVEYLVLDTDVAPHLQRGSLPAALNEHIRGPIACVTFVTVGEFFKGAFKRGWGERRVQQQLEAWLRNVVVLPYTAEISRVWGRVSADCEAKGQPIPANDAWIAACCLSHDLALMTLNRRHFERVEGLRLVPPAPVSDG